MPLHWTDRQQRNHEIVAMRCRGVNEMTIATKFGIDRSSVQRVMHDFRASNPTLRHVDPLQIVDEMLMGYQADLEELADVAEQATSDNARVGAINARMAARDRIVALLQSTGVLPHDLGKLRVELDVRFIAQRLVAVLSKHDVGEVVQRELLEALRGGSVIDAEPSSN